MTDSKQTCLHTPSPSPRGCEKSLKGGLEQQCLLVAAQDEIDNGVVENGRWLHVMVVFLFIWAVTLSLIWLSLPSHILRFSITALTAALIYFGSLQQVPLLANDAIAYVGDISYALYLFHWPVYVMVKPYSLEQPVGERIDTRANDG
ncbi:hypothetical protein Y032_0002g1038 [Ancylostoma ceylanicum]|uniref:Acyltransferase 3 domain-containing protein n=1 Tax=Ancylostoma ceylanicum TaxID=53326 RepID=A0A016W079_9BILA|nr:hypothetical protein Y032_0002g1038 [Ancylostoma ceylanicum]